MILEEGRFMWWNGKGEEKGYLRLGEGRQQRKGKILEG